MCPLGYGEIHTSCHAGGIASDLIRWISSASVILSPAVSRNVHPEPARRREKPFELGETFLRRGMRRMFPRGTRRMQRNGSHRLTLPLQLFLALERPPGL